MKSRKKTPAQMDREIAELLAASSAGRYMLGDTATGKDMREAHAFEVEQLQRNGGTGTLELGGGWNKLVRAYRVKLRLLNVHQPTRAQRHDPKLPAQTYAAVDRHGNVVATSSSVAGAMRHADTMLRTGALSVRGEYTSDGTHWGLGKGRRAAVRENGKWIVG